MLIRDAVVKPEVEAGCYLAHGKWVSPYDGFTTTNPTKIQIDHVVPLAVAWGSGAWRWTAATRKAFANDLGTRYDLLAVSGRANEAKGDSGPDEWLPPQHSFDCRYMADYTAVLWRWQLHIDARAEVLSFQAFARLRLAVGERAGPPGHPPQSDRRRRRRPIRRDRDRHPHRRDQLRLAGCRRRAATPA